MNFLIKSLNYDYWCAKSGILPFSSSRYSIFSLSKYPVWLSLVVIVIVIVIDLPMFGNENDDRLRVVMHRTQHVDDTEQRQHHQLVATEVATLLKHFIHIHFTFVYIFRLKSVQLSLVARLRLICVYTPAQNTTAKHFTQNCSIRRCGFPALCVFFAFRQLYIHKLEHKRICV